MKRLLFVTLLLFLLLVSCSSPGDPGDSDPDPKTYTITVDVPSNGRISGPDGLSCPSTCTTDVDEGTTVTLYAYPDAGYRFEAWTGACADHDGPTCSLIDLDGDLTLGSSFVLASSDPPDEPDPPEAPTIRLHFIDVGQGDAVLIEGTDGQTVLYDGGRSDDDALSYVQTLGIDSLDLVIASHMDADHIGGLDSVIRFYRPGLYIDNNLPNDTQAYEDLLDALAAAGTRLLAPTERTISLGGAELKVIPPPGDESLGQNDNSVGVLIDFGDFEASLTGDSAGDEFTWWQANVPDLLQEVEVYKSAHHGSKNGDTLESVQTWHPEAVVIGVGATNPYGHPSPEALGLYTGIGADVYRTDLHGHVIVTAKADGSYTIETRKEGETDPPPPPSNQLPVADFSAAPITGTAPLTVDFDASASSDPDGSIVSYAWDFGDGSSGSGITSSHTYVSEGSYMVSLTVTDDDDATDSFEKTITVNTPAEAGTARIVCVYYNPPGSDDGREYVRVEALGQVDFTGWSLRDAASHSFALPATTVEAGQTVTVPNYGGAVWNNMGDTAYLYDASGRLIDSHSYGGGSEGICS